MDSIDKQLIKLLQKDAHASCDRLGKAVGLSVSAVNERIKKLEKEKAILGWEARICPKKVELDILAFVKVLLEEQKAKKLFLEAIEKIPEVLEAHHITGEWSYLLKIRCRHIAHFESTMSEKISSLPGVIRTHTHIALSSPLERTLLPLDTYGS